MYWFFFFVFLCNIYLFYGAVVCVVELLIFVMERLNYKLNNKKNIKDLS